MSLREVYISWAEKKAQLQTLRPSDIPVGRPNSRLRYDLCQDWPDWQYIVGEHVQLTCMAVGNTHDKLILFTLRDDSIKCQTCQQQYHQHWLVPVSTHKHFYNNLLITVISFASVLCNKHKPWHTIHCTMTRHFIFMPVQSARPNSTQQKNWTSISFYSASE